MRAVHGEQVALPPWRRLVVTKHLEEVANHAPIDALRGVGKGALLPAVGLERTASRFGVQWATDWAI